MNSSFKEIIQHYAKRGIKVILTYSFKEDMLTTFARLSASKTNCAYYIKNIAILDFSTLRNFKSYEIVLYDRNFSVVKQYLYMNLEDAKEKFFEYITSPREWRYKT